MANNLSIFRHSLKKAGQHSFIVFLFSILPLIDSANGLYEGAPIGLAYKGMLVVILGLRILSKKATIKKRYIVCLMLCLMYIILSILVNISFGGKIEKAEYPIKLIFNLLLFVFLVENIEQKSLTGEDVYSILENSTIVFILCYLVPYLLGVGKSVYSGEIGYKAFFIAQNELGLVIIVMAFFTSFKLIQHTTIFDVIILSLVSLCGILLNTKTAILACIIAVLYWLIIMLFYGNNKIRILTISSMLLGVVFLKDYFKNAITAVSFRYNLLMSKYFNNSVLTGILSGRNNFVANAWEEFVGERLVIHLFLGNGFCSNILTEMDLLDIFFYLGPIGLISISVALWIIFRRASKNARKDSSKIRQISLLIIYLVMFVAGHILFMAVAGCFFALYCCFLLYYKPAPKQKLL